MKHSLSLLISLSFALGLASCGGSDDGSRSLSVSPNPVADAPPSHPPSHPGDWVLIPANAGGMGLDAFYVMKYEAKAWNDANTNSTIDGGEVDTDGLSVTLATHVPVSTADDQPWREINANDAAAEFESLGANRVDEGGPKARIKKKQGQIVFYPGKSLKELKRDLPESFRVLATTENRISPVTEKISDLKSNDKPNDESAKSELLFSLGSHYDSLHGKDQSDKTVFVSELQYSLGLEWKQHWNQRWKSFLGISTVFRKYLQTSSSNDKKLEDRKVTEGSIYGGGEYVWSEMSFAQFSLGLKESLYYQQTSENVYSLRKDPSLMFQLRLSQKLLSKGPLGVSGLAHLRHSLQGNQDFKGGTDYGLGFQMRHQVSQESTLGATLLYHQGKFKSSWSRFEHRWLDFILKYSIEF